MITQLNLTWLDGLGLEGLMLVNRFSRSRKPGVEDSRSRKLGLEDSRSRKLGFEGFNSMPRVDNNPDSKEF